MGIYRQVVTLALLTIGAPALATVAGPYRVVTGNADGSGGSRAVAGGVSMQGTAGQSDAGVLVRDGLELRGGFWPQVRIESIDLTPTATVTASIAVATATATPPADSSATATDTPSATPTPEANQTATASPTVTSSVPTFTTVPSPSPTFTPTPQDFAGDANCDGAITAADLPAVISTIVGGERALCGLDDVDRDGDVDLDDLMRLASAIFSAGPDSF